MKVRVFVFFLLLAGLSPFLAPAMDLTSIVDVENDDAISKLANQITRLEKELSEKNDLIKEYTKQEINTFNEWLEKGLNKQLTKIEQQSFDTLSGKLRKQIKSELPLLPGPDQKLTEEKNAEQSITVASVLSGVVKVTICTGIGVLGYLFLKKNGIELENFAKTYSFPVVLSLLKASGEDKKDS